MKQKTKDYIKSVVANKFTLAGYVGMGLTVATVYVAYKVGMDSEHFNTLLKLSGFISFWSVSSILMTGFGLETYGSYMDMKEHIENNKTITDEFSQTLPFKYCNRVGMEIAAREAGLEHLIEL